MSGAAIAGRDAMLRADSAMSKQCSNIDLFSVRRSGAAYVEV
jgi:hypothetical protein